MHTRILGALVRPPFLVRAYVSPAVFVLAALMFAGGALIGPTGAAAGPAVSYTTPVTYEGTNPCTGEMFSGTGNVHFLLSENVSASGVLEYHLNVRIDGLQAVAALSGKRYVVQDTLDHEFVFSKAAEDTFNLTAHFVRVGEEGALILGDDFYEYLRAHVTANANGTVTAFDVRMSDMPCQ